VYGLEDFGRMIADRARLDAHVEAFRRVVTPSSVVLDLGAGTGIMTLLACRAGARRVYAVEPTGIAGLISETAQANGYGDRVVILDRRSTEVTLPERADLIVSDLRGVLPPFESHFEDLTDARDRLLAPGGCLIPQTDTVWVTICSAPDVFEERRQVWSSDLLGLSLRSALPRIDNSPFKHRARPEDCLSPPVEWARLHYPTLRPGAVRSSGTCTIAADGVAHGLLAWFDTVLVDGVGYSNAPGRPATIYGQLLFPWPQPVALRSGDQVGFELRADPIAAHCFWTWTTEIRRAGPEGPLPPLRFRQSTFGGMTILPGSLRRRASTFAPALSPAGEIALQVLEGVRAGKTVGELAAELQAARPDRFPSTDAAHGAVAALVERYGA
jgi:protein arginine N-methyltransferase 1